MQGVKESTKWQGQSLVSSYSTDYAEFARWILERKKMAYQTPSLHCNVELQYPADAATMQLNSMYARLLHRGLGSILHPARGQVDVDIRMTLLQPQTDLIKTVFNGLFEKLYLEGIVTKHVRLEILNQVHIVLDGENLYAVVYAPTLERVNINEVSTVKLIETLRVYAKTHKQAP